MLINNVFNDILLVWKIFKPKIKMYIGMLHTQQNLIYSL